MIFRLRNYFHLLRLLIVVESCSKRKERSYHPALNAKHLEFKQTLGCLCSFYFIEEVYRKASLKA